LPSELTTLPSRRAPAHLSDGTLGVAIVDVIDAKLVGELADDGERARHVPGDPDRPSQECAPLALRVVDVTP